MIHPLTIHNKPSGAPVVGQLALGGVVAYIATIDLPAYDLEAGDGLIMSTDTLNDVLWSNIEILVPTTSVRGDINTAAIIAQVGHATSAAKSCVDYVSDIYNDWYLPSKDEFQYFILPNRNSGVIVNYIPIQERIALATEHDAGNGFYIDFNTINVWLIQYAGKSSNNYKVKAVRKFRKTDY